MHTYWDLIVMGGVSSSRRPCLHKDYLCGVISRYMDLKLDGSTAIVTASSKGLGKAVARELVSEGATVVLSSRSKSNLKRAKRDILDATGADASAVEPIICDLAHTASIENAITDAVEHLGGLDILVTNHGGPPAYSFAESTLEDFDDVYTSVLKSTIAVIKATLPHLRNGGGSVTNIVSASAQEPPANHVLSNTIRPGIYGLSKSLSNEYAEDGVRVNCVCPRGISTDRIEYKVETLAEHKAISTSEARERRTDELPLDRLGDRREFAKAVTYIASDAASFTTGSILRVDGGWARDAF